MSLTSRTEDRCRGAATIMRCKTEAALWEPFVERVTDAINGIIMVNRQKYRLTNEDAEDIFQTVWLVMLQQGVTHVENKPAYAITTTYNVITSMYRRRAARSRAHSECVAMAKASASV